MANHTLIKLTTSLCFITSLTSSYAIPTFDAGKLTAYVKEYMDNVQYFEAVTKSYVNQWLSAEHGSAASVDSWNNGFANQIIRDNQAKSDQVNQTLKASYQPLDICATYALSGGLNDFICEALESVSNSNAEYTKNLTKPYALREVVEKTQQSQASGQSGLEDITLIAASTSPPIIAGEDVEIQADKLTEQAHKVLVHALLSSAQADQHNVYATLSNSAIDDFNSKEIQALQEEGTKSTLYRRQAVLMAKAIYFQLVDYKHQLAREVALADRLL
ncbi:hypothetical protein [Cysteiniphilum marinum]|uniref:hypothetical protein n=1 Tax=Cysteiniphilum marinum TaxID=2774191 RepID=UPI00193BC1C9|nr:hypothetical protein [Cysteiniphilum marinum]